MTDKKELDKLFEYGMMLLDSMEKDSLLEYMQANELKDKLAKEKEKFQEIVTDMENILNRIKE